MKEPKARIRFAVLFACAFVAACDPVIAFLRGHGLWLLGVVAVLSLSWPLLERKKLIATEAAREAYSLLFAVLGLGVQYDSHFMLIAGMPYVFRVVVLLLMLAVWAWLGRKMYAVFAPETAEERARP